LRTGSHNFVGIIEFQDLFGAEMNTDTASLAPFPVDDVFFEFGFCHVGSLEVSIEEYPAACEALPHTKTCRECAYQFGSNNNQTAPQPNFIFYIKMLSGEAAPARDLNPCGAGSMSLFEY
jgi:hypothetical protein